MGVLNAIVDFHVNAFTFLVYEVQSHWGALLAFVAIGYLFYQDLKDQDTKFVYDKRSML